jgi:hypothetical protein
LFYTIYKITNTIDGKFYIGKHQTKDLDDGYFGSGKLLKRAIKKYGLDNFHKEIIKVCSSEKEMDLVEKILVVPDSEISYNLCNGGQGGFSYINSHIMTSERRSKIQKDKPAEYYERLNNSSRKSSSVRMKIIHDSFPGKIKPPNWTGKKHSEETKIKMRKPKNIGINNWNYNTCWITNGQENKKIKKNELDNWFEKGYYKGRIS